MPLKSKAGFQNRPPSTNTRAECLKAAHLPSKQVDRVRSPMPAPEFHPEKTRLQRAQAGASAWRHHPARCRDCTTPRTAADIDLQRAGQQRTPIHHGPPLSGLFYFPKESAQKMKHYRDWPLLDELPPGWKFCRHAGSPVTGYAFAQSASVLKGGKTALVKITPPTPTTNENFK